MYSFTTFLQGPDLEYFKMHALNYTADLVANGFKQAEFRNYIWSLQPRQPGHEQLGSHTVFTVTVVKVFSGRGRHLLPAGRKYEVGPLLKRCEAAVATRLRKSGGSSSQRDAFALQFARRPL